VTPALRLELAATARADVARVISLLERPTVWALNQSAAELSEAIARMEQLKGEFAGEPVASPGKAVVAEVIVALRKDLGRAMRLLRHAWELRTGRGGELEYTKRGEWVRQPVATTRWAVEA
jgi:hypothetical protein